MKDILVPISFSASSQHALRHAYAIAKQYRASLSLLHCYPTQDYNREYDFGKKSYEQGIKGMLRDFFDESIEDANSPFPYQRLTYAGSLADMIPSQSAKADLLVMSRKTGLPTQKNKWFSQKIAYLASKSACPVLILTNHVLDFSFRDAENVWHIKRNEIEPSLVEQELARFGIESTHIITKSLLQETFVSTFWRNIVSYSKKADDKTLTEITESFKKEKIDLLVLVNHKKRAFEHFLMGDSFQILSQLDIPIFILQNKS